MGYFSVAGLHRHQKTQAMLRAHTAILYTQQYKLIKSKSQVFTAERRGEKEAPLVHNAEAAAGKSGGQQPCPAVLRGGKT